MTNNLKRIGTNSKNYAHQRLILNKIPHVRYVDLRFRNVFFWKNLHHWVFKYYLGLTKMSPSELYIKLFLKFKSVNNLFPKIDLIHFFNVINYSKNIPWVVSIETCLPHNHLMSNFIESKNPDYKNIKSDKYTIGVLKALSQDNCIGLIALSECTKNMQLEMLKAFPEFETILKSKITVLHPPQKLLINSIDQKGLSYEKDEALRFIFIGRDFLRKGGSEILKVFKEFSNDEQYKFELILITDINDKENFLFFNQKDIDNINNIISENPKWIKHYKELSNDKVLELIIKSHIGLLPTWMDTYGFSVLECQAGGCPVITTDIRALTEINNEELGWLIKFPANKLKHPIYESKKEFEICQEIIENGLRNILKDVFQNKQKIKEKAEASLNSIKTNHDEKKYTNQLKEIYEQKAFQEINKFHRKELTFSS